MQLSATTFTASTTISGGRTTFGSAGLSLSALGGACTAPVTSTFLFTFADQFESDDPPSTYIDADPPSALVRTYAVPPSVVFACTTQPVSVDLGAALFSRRLLSGLLRGRLLLREHAQSAGEHAGRYRRGDISHEKLLVNELPTIDRRLYQHYSCQAHNLTRLQAHSADETRSADAHTVKVLHLSGESAAGTRTSAGTAPVSSLDPSRASPDVRAMTVVGGAPDLLRLWC